MRKFTKKASLAAVCLSLAGVATAAPVTSSFNQFVNANGTDIPWFIGGTGTFAGDIASGAGATSNISTQIAITRNGSATEGSGFTDGNGLPAGVSISYDLAFSITAIGGGNLINKANSNFGFGVSGGATADAIDPSEGFFVSAVTVSNLQVVSDTNGYLEDSVITASTPEWLVIRSADHGVGSGTGNTSGNGELLTVSSDAAQTADLTVFGMDGQAPHLNNNFGDGIFNTSLPSYYAVSTGTGDFTIKGMGFETAFTVNVPEPASFALLSLGALLISTGRRKTA